MMLAKIGQQHVFGNVKVLHDYGRKSLAENKTTAN